MDCAWATETSVECLHRKWRHWSVCGWCTLLARQRHSNPSKCTLFKYNTIVISEVVIMHALILVLADCRTNSKQEIRESRSWRQCSNIAQQWRVQPDIWREDWIARTQHVCHLHHPFKSDQWSYLNNCPFTSKHLTLYIMACFRFIRSTSFTSDPCWSGLLRSIFLLLSVRTNSRPSTLEVSRWRAINCSSIF